MKKFTITCAFGGQNGNVTVYIGQPESAHHPIHFQSEWLSKEKGGVIPKQVMDSLAKLHEISIRNNVPFEDLCEYALESAKHGGDAKKVAGPEGDQKLESGAAQDSKALGVEASVVDNKAAGGEEEAASGHTKE
jgi:hypothetical protein